MSNEARVEILDTIRGKSFLAVQRASQELARHNLEVVGYKITVMKEGNSIHVTFIDQNAPPGGRGAGGMKRGFEVELDAVDLRIIGSNFIR